VRVNFSGRMAFFAALAMAMATPGASHHSTAMFEWGTSTELKGVTIERWDWTNPHTFLYVKDAAGNRWAFEGMSPSHLARAGWTKRSIQAGEKVDLTYFKLRDGRRGGFNVSITKADGTVLRQTPART
jgi:hypothetical protein